MRKVLIVTLCLAAAAIYTWNIYQVIRALAGAGGERGTVVAADMQEPGLPPLTGLRNVKFIPARKSPFSARATVPAAAAAGTKGPTVAAPAPKVEKRVETAPTPLPSITISGIMWHETNPVAMLVLPDGSSSVARSGQELVSGLRLKKIERNRIQVTFNGRDHWITQ